MEVFKLDLKQQTNTVRCLMEAMEGLALPQVLSGDTPTSHWGNV